MGRPPKSDTRDVRRLLLDEAIRVISRDGEAAVRTRAIAESAGVTEPSLFHYFGNREGLIEEAQATRFEEMQVDLYGAFRDNVVKCRTREEFDVVVIKGLAAPTSPTRASVRTARMNIAGGVATRPNLARRLAEAQRGANSVLIEALAYGQAHGWVSRDLNLEAFAMWFAGQTTGRFFAELEPDEDLLRDWDSIMVRATLSVLGIDHPDD